MVRSSTPQQPLESWPLAVVADFESELIANTHWQGLHLLGRAAGKEVGHSK
jgi:hypothetical protein